MKLNTEYLPPAHRTQEKGYSSGVVGQEYGRSNFYAGVCEWVLMKECVYIHTEIENPNPRNVFFKEPGLEKGLEGHILAGHGIVRSWICRCA